MPSCGSGLLCLMIWLNSQPLPGVLLRSNRSNRSNSLCFAAPVLLSFLGTGLMLVLPKLSQLQPLLVRLHEFIAAPDLCLLLLPLLQNLPLVPLLIVHGHVCR